MSRRGHASGLVALALSCAVGVACSDPEPVVEVRSPEEHGAELFRDPGLSGTPSNRLACSDCHAETADSTNLRLPGAPLAGVTRRASLWGGQEADLLRSINHCRFYFMRASESWTGEEEEARYLYAYLASLEGDGAPAPFTLGDVVDPGEGDPKRGKALYLAACQSCHGIKDSGLFAIVPSSPRLPDDTIAAHPYPEYTNDERRLVFVEKTRHGGFLGYGGTMPPYSLEVLSDADLADILTYLGVP